MTAQCELCECHVCIRETLQAIGVGEAAVEALMTFQTTGD
jgi:hypothetical protein